MLNKVCFEQKVAKRAQIFPLKGNRRVKTLRILSKSKISGEIMQGVCGRQTHSKSYSLEEIMLMRAKTRSRRWTHRRKVKG
jgi:hypothetical protein